MVLFCSLPCSAENPKRSFQDLVFPPDPFFSPLFQVPTRTRKQPPTSSVSLKIWTRGGTPRRSTPTSPAPQTPRTCSSSLTPSPTSSSRTTSKTVGFSKDDGDDHFLSWWVVTKKWLLFYLNPSDETSRVILSILSSGGGANFWTSLEGRGGSWWTSAVLYATFNSFIYVFVSELWTSVTTFVQDVCIT